MSGTLALTRAFFVNALFTPQGVSVEGILFSALILQGRGALRMGSVSSSMLPRRLQPVFQAPAPLTDLLLEGCSPVSLGSLHLSR